jgi:hypothetical protein
MDTLNSCHGLAQAFFPIPSTDDVSAFSSSSDSLDEKPYVHPSHELVDVLKADRTIIISRRMHVPSTYFKDPRARLALLAVLSLLTLLANFLLRPTISSYIKSRHIRDRGYEPVPSIEPDESGGRANTGEESGKGKSFPERNGGWRIFTWGVLRLLGLVAFEVLTVLAVFQAERRKEKLVESTLAAVFVIIVFLLLASAPQLKLMVGSIGFTHQGYLIALSALSLTFRPTVSPSLNFAFKLHLIGILLVVSSFSPLLHPDKLILTSSLVQAWIVFAHRDIYPMITFTIRSADKLDVLMWVRLGVRFRFCSASACPLLPGRSPS